MTDDTPYPAAKMLMDIRNTLELTDDELRQFLQLSDDVGGKARLRSFLEKPGEYKFAPDVLTRVKWAVDICLTLEHDYHGKERIRKWTDAEHQTFGYKPRFIIVARPLEEVWWVRQEVCPAVPEILVHDAMRESIRYLRSTFSLSDDEFGRLLQLAADAEGREKQRQLLADPPETVTLHVNARDRIFSGVELGVIKEQDFAGDKKKIGEWVRAAHAYCQHETPLDVLCKRPVDEIMDLIQFEAANPT